VASPHVMKGIRWTRMNLEEGGHMSKTGIAIGAFALGLFCSVLFSAPQAEHKGSSVPQIHWPDFHTNVITGGSGTGANSVMSLEGIGAVPFFNSLDHMPVMRDFRFISSGQTLDGLNCENCEFKDARLRYGGGVLSLKGSTFSGTTELQLEGAAANTIAVLEFLKAIPGGRLTYKLPINKPITRKFASSPKPSIVKLPTPTPQQHKLDFTSPYIGSPK
jgi:hypothetical protein